MTRLLLDARRRRASWPGPAIRPAPTSAAAIRELATLVAAVADRRPDLPIVLAGRHVRGARRVRRRRRATRRGPARAGRRAVRQPRAAASPLGDLLLELALPADDPRRAIGPATQALADVLDRRVETIVLGHDACRPGRRRSRRPAAARRDRASRGRALPRPSPPEDPDDARRRRRARLVDRRLRSPSPARPAARAAHRPVGRCGRGGRRAAHGRGSGRPGPARRGHDAETSTAPGPDLVVAGGGVWSAVPAPTVALAIVDVVRRPGASQFALDHARLLGAARVRSRTPANGWRSWPTSSTTCSRPLGSVVTPAGLRAGRSAGTLIVHADGGTSELELVPGRPRARRPAARARPRWPSSASATRSGSGTRGRHFAVDVAGGLGGLLVDLRDVPLRLPERADRRRDLLSAWQAALWAGATRERGPRWPEATDLGFVSARRLVDGAIDVIFRLAPGDRPLVEAGESVVAGTPIADRLRDARLSDVSTPPALEPKPGESGAPRGSSCSTGGDAGASPAGRSSEPLETPVAGIVRERPARDARSSSGRRGARCAASSRSAGRRVAASTSRPVRRGAARGWPRRRPGRDDPRRRLADRCGDPDPGAGDGRPRDRRRLGSPARSVATSSPRRGASRPPSIDCRRTRCSCSMARSVVRSRRARSWTSCAALAGRDVAIVNDPPMLLFDAPDVDLAGAPRRTSSGSAAATSPAARGTGRAWPGRAGSPAASISRPARCGSRTARSWPSRLGDLERFD